MLFTNVLLDCYTLNSYEFLSVIRKKGIEIL